MTTLSPALPVTLLALAALVSLGAGAPGDELMKPADQKKLGKLVAEYFDAKDESAGIDKAYQEIADTIDKLEKKLAGQSALAYVEDWEQVFFQARLESLGDDLKVRKGKPHTTSAALPNGSVDFAVSVPGSYNPKKDVYPLFVLIAAPGTEPLALVEEQWATGELVEGAIVLAPKMPEDLTIWGEINGPSGPGGVSTIMGLFGQFLRQFPIDMDRVYLVGYGAGADAVARVAGMYPHLFAGLVLIDGSAAIDPSNFGSLPTLVVGEGEGCQALAKKSADLGHANAAAQPSATPAEVRAWSADKLREAYPAEITFVPLTDYTTSAHWISLQGADVAGGARIEARLNPATNAIEIDAVKVTGVRLFLNDRLVDMDKPVDVVINGVSEPPLSIDRNKRLMLDLNYTNGDWGRVFTNRMDFDVPAGEAK